MKIIIENKQAKLKRIINEEIVKMHDEQLAEKTRADKEGVQLPSMVDQLASYIEEDSDGIPVSYITFTSLNKLGINPRSEHNTPNGIYTYPLTPEIFAQLKSGTLPYAQDQAYVSLVQPQDRGAIATSNMFDDVEFRSACIKLYSKDGAGELAADNASARSVALDYRMLMHDTGGRNPSWEQVAATKSFMHAQKTASYQLPFGVLWNLTRLAANDNPNRWSAIWRALGYDGALDMGRGIIHNAESTQAVFFARNVVDLIKTFVNKETPKKISARYRVMYIGAAGKIASSAFQRGGLMADFMKYQSWSLGGAWLEENIRERIAEDLEWLHTTRAAVDDYLSYPWLDIIGKQDIDPRTKEGYEKLVRDIADPASAAHKIFWSHEKTLYDVLMTYKARVLALVIMLRDEAKYGRGKDDQSSADLDAINAMHIFINKRLPYMTYEEFKKFLVPIFKFIDDMMLKFPKLTDEWAAAHNSKLKLMH